MPGQRPVADALAGGEHGGVLDDRRGMLDIVDTEEPAFQLAQNPLTVAVRPT